MAAAVQNLALLASLVACVSSAASTTAAQTTHDHRYTEDPALRDSLFTQGVVLETTARSGRDCAGQCSQRERCLSWTFLRGASAASPGTCRGHALGAVSRGAPAATARGAKTFRRAGQRLLLLLLLLLLLI